MRNDLFIQKLQRHGAAHFSCSAFLNYRLCRRPAVESCWRISYRSGARQIFSYWDLLMAIMTSVPLIPLHEACAWSAMASIWMCRSFSFGYTAFDTASLIDLIRFQPVYFVYEVMNSWVRVYWPCPDCAQRGPFLLMPPRDTLGGD